jgi:hypothetical protein
MQLFQKAKVLDRIKGISSLEVVSKPRITPEGKAQADSKAQQPRQVVSI